MRNFGAKKSRDVRDGARLGEKLVAELVASHASCGRLLALDVGEHLAAMPIFGALREKLGTAFERAPLDNGDFDFTCTPVFHHRIVWFENIDGGSSREGGAVVVHDVEVGLPSDAEHGAYGVERPIGGGTADAITVTELRASGILTAVDEVIAFFRVVRGGTNEAIANAERINGHSVAVFALRCGSAKDDCGWLSNGCFARL